LRSDRALVPGAESDDSPNVSDSTWLYTCQRERERERESASERERARARESEQVRESERVRESETARERDRERESERERERESRGGGRESERKRLLNLCDVPHTCDSNLRVTHSYL